MRIRRHAKISPAPPLQTHACQLNQSPWDAMEFAPPSVPPQPPPPPPKAGAGAFAAGNGSFNDCSCSRKRGEKQSEYSLKVEQQISPTAEKNDSSYAYGPAARKPKAHRQARPKKSSSSSSSTNPYEFYYYSGFGPRWAKKRGPNCEADDNGGTTNKRHDYSCEESDNDEPDYEELEGEEEEKKERKRARKPIKARSLKSLM